MAYLEVCFWTRPRQHDKRHRNHNSHHSSNNSSIKSNNNSHNIGRGRGQLSGSSDDPGLVGLVCGGGVVHERGWYDGRRWKWYVAVALQAKG